MNVAAAFVAPLGAPYRSGGARAAPLESALACTLSLGPPITLFENCDCIRSRPD